MSKIIDYRLVIESKELSRAFLLSALITIILCSLGVLVWKDSLDNRGIQWKSHSSFYSSKGRIFAANNSIGKYDTIFLGSSITGRIPGIESGYKGWANLGIEASSAQEGLNLMLKGLLPTADYVVVEMDTINLEKNVYKKPEEELNHDIALGPLFNPIYRASTLFYTELRNERFSVNKVEPWGLRCDKQVPVDTNQIKFTQTDMMLMEKLRQVREKFGSKLLLVLYPRKDRTSSVDMRNKTAAIATKLGIPWMDFNATLPEDVKVHFSDHVHMVSGDALRVAKTIRKEICRMYRTSASEGE